MRGLRYCLPLAAPLLLGGCINFILGAHVRPSQSAPAYARSYNDDSGTGATYDAVAPVRGGLLGGLGLGFGDGARYVLVSSLGVNATLVRGEAKSAEGRIVEEFQVEQGEGGVMVEVGRSKGPYVGAGVMRRDVKSYVNDQALGSSLSADEHGYLGRLEVGLNRGSDYGVFSIFVGGEVPLKAGGPVLPTRYTVEGGRRVFGPDPQRAVGPGFYLGVRMGLFVGCACP